MVSDFHSLGAKRRVVEKHIACFTLIGTSDKIVALVRFNDLQPREDSGWC